MIGTIGKGVALAGAAALAWGVGIERRWYATRHETLPLLRGEGRLRILFFADLHLAPGQDHRLDHVRRVAEEVQPDLLVSGGDNLEHPDAIGPVVALHERLREVTGAPAWAVLGAHDRFGPRRGNPAAYLWQPSEGPRGEALDTPALVKGMEDSGWQVLCNDTATVSTPAGPIEVAGVDDPHIERDDLSIIRPAGAVEDPVLRLGLTHAPYLRVLHGYDRAGFDLALAGHTHGGQLAVPWWGALVSNSDLPPAQAKGTSLIGTDLHLHVSAGLGHSVYYPVRFACRPELTVLDLVGR